jgi:hypothetical protein
MFTSEDANISFTQFLSLHLTALISLGDTCSLELSAKAIFEIPLTEKTSYLKSCFTDHLLINKKIIKELIIVKLGRLKSRRL